MTAQPNSDPKPGIVQNLRSIRDQLSHEIKDMTFEQERAYLDQLLADKSTASARPSASSPANASALP